MTMNAATRAKVNATAKGNTTMATANAAAITTMRTVSAAAMGTAITRKNR